MKRLLLIILCVWPIISEAQEVLSYSKVIPIEAVNASDLYDRAEVWFTTTFRNANKVIHQKDKANGLILSKAIMEHKCSKMSGRAIDGTIGYSLNVYIKDGRIKFEMTDMSHTSKSNHSFDMGLFTTSEDCPIAMLPAGKKWRNEVWQEAKDRANAEFILLSLSITETLSKPLETQKDDW